VIHLPDINARLDSAGSESYFILQPLLTRDRIKCDTLRFSCSCQLYRVPDKIISVNFDLIICPDRQLHYVT